MICRPSGPSPTFGYNSSKEPTWTSAHIAAIFVTDVLNKMEKPIIMRSGQWVCPSLGHAREQIHCGHKKGNQNVKV
jgi:hypothetical protein